MGVKGAKDPKGQERWNRFRALLVEAAGLPTTSLVRLCFINSEGQQHELQNLDDLRSISKQYGTVHTDGDRCSVSLQIVIEVLALNVSEYRMRFKYEQELFMKEHQIESARSDSGHGALSELQKGRLSQFVLSPLTTTRAVIRKGLKQSEQSKQSASGSMSPAIDIMDMLNVNQSPSDRADPDPVRSEPSLWSIGPSHDRNVSFFWWIDPCTLTPGTAPKEQSRFGRSPRECTL